MDRVATLALVEPDHDQPAGGARPPGHLVRPPLRQVDLDAIRIGQDLLDLLQGDASLWVVLAEVPAVRGQTTGRSSIQGVYTIRHTRAFARATSPG